MRSTASRASKSCCCRLFPDRSPAAARPARPLAVRAPCCCCVAPLVFRAPEGPAVGPGRWVCRWAAAGPVDGVAVLPHGCFGRRRARPPARLGALTSFGAAPRSPPVPSGPSGALHTSGACGVLGGLAPRLEARPGPAAPAISHAIPLRLFQTLNSDRCNCNGVLTGASLAYLVQHVAGLKPVAPLRPGLRGGVKPLAPLLAQAEPQVKPPSPLRGENAVIPGVVGLQRCWRFHWSTPGGVQRCCWFQSRHVAAPCARKSSPCAAWCGREREKVRPASPKWPKNAVFRRVGRTFSRKCRWKPCAGRLLPRSSLSCSLWACVIRAASLTQ